MRPVLLAAIFAVFAQMFSVQMSFAQTSAAFPSKPIRWIVDFPAGGVSDMVARAVGQQLSEAWASAVVFDNRPGANGIIATQAVAKASPDGYTLGLISTGFSLNVTLHPALPYNSLRDLTPVSLIATRPNVLVVHPGVPAKSVRDLIALAKQKPGVLNYASVGIGSSPHLSGEMLKKHAGVDIVHVPYNGSGPALIDLIVGRVDLMFIPLPAALPHIRSGKINALAVTDTTRTRVLPQVPTMIESGLPHFILVGWYGVVVPAGVSREVVSRYSAEFARILNLPDVRERIASLGAEARAMAPAEFATFLRDDIARNAELIKSSGAKVDN